MLVSEARKTANRANAAKSTGPKTPEGKAASRSNALIHGLCATIVVVEDADLLQARAEMFYKAIKPYTDYQAWQVDRGAVLSVRIERCERMERRVRDKDALLAELGWDDDRRMEAEVLGGTIAKHPAEVVEALKRTPQGCNWLITRWAMLAHAADTQSGIRTDEQSALAFDMMGTPAVFRPGRKPGTTLDLKGHLIDRADDSASVARRMVDSLLERREAVADADQVKKALAVADVVHDTSDELRRLRRYESALQNRLRWTINEMKYQGPLGNPDPGYHPTWKVDNPPELKPEPKTNDEKAAEAHDYSKASPPFCLTPDEYPAIDAMPDIPKILESRRKKRLAKADARRESKRRMSTKIEGLISRSGEKSSKIEPTRSASEPHALQPSGSSIWEKWVKFTGGYFCRSRPKWAIPSILMHGTGSAGASHRSRSEIPPERSHLDPVDRDKMVRLDHGHQRRRV